MNFLIPNSSLNKLTKTIFMFTLAVCLVAQMPRCGVFVCGRSIVSDVDGNYDHLGIVELGICVMPLSSKI